MRTLYLIGFVDWLSFDISQINYPCFSKDITYFVELSREVSDEDLVYESVNDLRKKLENRGLMNFVIDNIAQLAALGAKIKPLVSLKHVSSVDFERTVDERSIDLMTTLEDRIKSVKGDVAFFGGNTHADYFANHLSFEHKVLYNLDIEQSRNKDSLKKALINYYSRIYCMDKTKVKKLFHKSLNNF